jgi:hypothetical protein
LHQWANETVQEAARPPFVDASEWEKESRSSPRSASFSCSSIRRIFHRRKRTAVLKFVTALALGASFSLSRDSQDAESNAVVAGRVPSLGSSLSLARR